MARRRGKYRSTPKRRAALKKAQLTSARKRRGKKLAIGVGVLAIGTGGVLAAKQIHGSRSRKNLVTSQKQAVGSLTGASTGGRDIVANPPKVPSRPIKKVKVRGPLYEPGDLSHVSNRGKQYREDGKNSTGEGASGAAPSRVVVYEPSEKHVAETLAFNKKFEAMMRRIQAM